MTVSGNGCGTSDPNGNYTNAKNDYKDKSCWMDSSYSLDHQTAMVRLPLVLRSGRSPGITLIG
jgi:hypothetical protein